jgi:hypothetical protein
MKSSDLFKAILIIFLFFMLYLLSALASGKKYVEDNWATMRCNPTVMPFADQFGHDTKENFDYCIQNMQSDYMHYLLEPVNYSIDLLNQASANSNFGLQGARNFMSNFRFMSADIFQNIFGVFMNTILVFQNMIIKMKDMLAKVVGVIASLMYILQGSFQTMDSAWAGPMGGLVRSLA